MRKLYITFLLLMLTVVALPQAKSTDEIISLISEKYRSISGMSFNISYLYYTDASAASPYKTILGEVSYFGDMYYYRLDGMETIKNRTHFLMIDSKNNRIMLDSSGSMQRSHEYNIDSLNKNYKSIELKSDNKGNRIVFNYKSDEAMEKVVVFYNTTYLITEIEIWYAAIEDEYQKEYHPKLRVLYSKFNTNITKNDTVFSSEKYIKTINGVWRLQPPYTHYQFINNLAN